MALVSLFLLKPLFYALVLSLAATRLRTAKGPNPQARQLVLLAVARVVLGVALGTAAFLLLNQILDVGTTYVAMGLLGLGLWVGVMKLAFKGASMGRLVLFSVVAEALSIGWDFLMLGAVNKLPFRLC